MAQLISEILETDAEGEIARIYSEIRQLWGVPNVTTIVRHLASIPGCLEWFWAMIGPVNECGDFQETANAMAETLDVEPLPKLPELALRAMGVDTAAEQQIRDVYNAYDRNNRPNIFFVCTLKRLLHRGASGAGPYVPRRSGWTPPVQLPPLIPMVQAKDMPPETLALAQAIGSWGFPPDTGFLPGVYRHLANWPAYTAHVGAVLWSYLDAGELLRAGSVVISAAEAAAEELVRELPSPGPEFPAPDAEAAAGLIRVFNGLVPKIPEMIIVCKLLGEALPDTRTD